MKSVLNYFVRKAFGFTATATDEDNTLFGHLLRIRKNIHKVYEWLYARCPADAWWLARRMPMTEALTDQQDGHEVRVAKAWNSANLLAHLRLLDGRKITNCYADGRPADDGLPDGVSLARLLCDSSLQPTELIDDNVGWTMDKAINNFFKATKIQLGCKEVDFSIFDYNGGTFLPDAEWHFPNLKRLVPQTINVGFGHGFINCAVQTHDVYLPELEEITAGSNFGLIRGINATNTAPFALYAPKLKRLGSGVSIFSKYNACTSGIAKLVLGKIETSLTLNANYGGYMNLPNLIHLEFGEGTKASLNLAGWLPSAETLSNPLFLSNFREYIASRLADRSGSSTLTLTLSQEVRDVLTADIEQIITNKNWVISPAKSV